MPDPSPDIFAQIDEIVDTEEEQLAGKVRLELEGGRVKKILEEENKNVNLSRSLIAILALKAYITEGPSAEAIDRELQSRNQEQQEQVKT